MKTSTKIWLIIAASLIILGLIIFMGVMSMGNWDFSKLGTVKFETNTYELSEEFSGISIKTDTADINFLPSDDGICRVICYEQNKVKHAARVSDGQLSINVVDERAWYEYIGITFGTPKMTVYLPRAEYGELVIKNSTGDVELPADFAFETVDISVSTGDIKCFASASGAVRIRTTTGDILAENISAESLDLSVSTGRVDLVSADVHGSLGIKVSTGRAVLTDVSCGSLVSNGTTGDISMQNVIAAENISVTRSTGDVKFEKCDAAELIIKTDTGDVTGSLLSGKVFIAKSDTGRISVPRTVSGGICEITTDTGNINIEITAK